jgi:hypothetical protein
VAFPFGVLPSRTGETTATALWLASFGLLLVPLVAVLLLSNVAAVLAKEGRCLCFPRRCRPPSRLDPVIANSTADSSLHLPLLVDRWAAPDWVPLANVFSLGDVLIAVGGLVVVLAAMEPRVLRRAARAGA